MTRAEQTLYRYTNHLAATGPKHYNQPLCAGLAIIQLALVKAERQKRTERKSATTQCAVVAR